MKKDIIAVLNTKIKQSISPHPIRFTAPVAVSFTLYASV